MQSKKKLTKDMFPSISKSMVDEVRPLVWVEKKFEVQHEQQDDEKPIPNGWVILENPSELKIRKPIGTSTFSRII
jgi:hypothetical protein